MEAAPPAQDPRPPEPQGISTAAGLPFAAPTPGSVTSQPPPPEHASSFHSDGQPRASPVMVADLLFPAVSELLHN